MNSPRFGIRWPSTKLRISTRAPQNLLTPANMRSGGFRGVHGEIARNQWKASALHEILRRVVAANTRAEPMTGAEHDHHRVRACAFPVQPA